MDFRRLQGIEQRKQYNRKTARGREYIFQVRENFSDFTFINSFVDQDFIDRNQLFVAGRRLNKQRMVWEYYVRSRKADDYRQMLFASLYHPPKIEMIPEKSTDGCLYLSHQIEGKPLVNEYIANTMLGIEYLWGNPVKLETSEAEVRGGGEAEDEEQSPQISWTRVLYTMKDRQLSRETI